MGRNRLMKSLLAGACALALASGAAYAQSRDFDVPAGDLKVALDAYARQSGLQLIYRVEDIRGVRSQGARGTLATEEALVRILAGTGFSVVRDASGAAAIVRTSGQPQRENGAQHVPAPTGQSAAAEPQETPTADAVARSAPSTDVGDLDMIVVTGTRIRGEGGAAPVYIFDQEDFAAAGASSVQQALRTLPQNFTGGSSETASAVVSTRNGNENNVAFGAGVNLRGLGTESTLVLLNGRRLAPGGYGNLTDMSIVPLGALKRIEVMPDGASAIYGSDAVGGVVNLILRDDFEGAETRLRYGTVTDGSLRQYGASQLWGTAWDTGAVLFNLDYGRNEPLFASERPYATGLQEGIVYLSPSDERRSLFINGQQDLTPDLTLSAVFYDTTRDFESRMYEAFNVRQSMYAGTTDQRGGTLALDWRVGDNWTWTLAHTRSRTDIERDNSFGDSPAGPAFENRLLSEHDVGATELEAEGAAFSLPGGDARLAFGAERRTEKFLVDLGDFGRSRYEREVGAGYAELFLPLVGEANANAFAKRLNLTLAARYEDYDDVGAADTYKVGLLWSPVDHVNLRATYGTSFRAPYLYQYDASVSGGLIIDLPDPTSATGVTRTALVIQMPDSDLGPENATIWTAGFDIDPDLFGFRVSATYFDIDYKDRIRAARFTAAVFTDPSLLPLLSRPPDPWQLALLDEVANFFNLTPGDLSTVEAFFDGRTRNQASTRMRGIDLNIGKDFDTRLGAFSAGLNLSKLLSHDIREVAALPPVDILDTIYNPLDLRARASLVWTKGNWSASAFVNYTDDYVDNQLPETPSGVPSWTTVDLGLGYAFGGEIPWLRGLSLQFNALNAFDRDPPRIIDLLSSYGSPGYDTENANPFGRIVSLEVRKSW